MGGESVIDLESDYASAYNQRGLIEQALKHYDQAIAAFTKAHELDSTEPAFANNVADTYRLQTLYDQAAEWVERALSIQSDYAWAYNQRGLIAQEGQQYEAATAAFKKAFESSTHVKRCFPITSAGAWS